MLSTRRHGWRVTCYTKCARDRKQFEKYVLKSGNKHQMKWLLKCVVRCSFEDDRLKIIEYTGTIEQSIKRELLDIRWIVYHLNDNPLSPSVNNEEHCDYITLHDVLLKWVLNFLKPLAIFLLWHLLCILPLMFISVNLLKPCLKLKPRS